MSDSIEKDQHFLIDQTIIIRLIESATITKDDIILEIGAGSGNITLPLSKKTNHVFVSELDPKFFPSLQNIPNTTIIPGNILKTLLSQKHITTVIGNIPYQITEPLLHLFCKSHSIHKASLILPKTFSQRIQQHPIFSAFWNITIIQDVPSSSFEPKPRGTSVIATLNRRTDNAIQSFIFRKLYLQPTKKLKNGLRETLIDYYNTKHITLTKKQAEIIIAKLSPPPADQKISSLKPLDYIKISQQIKEAIQI